MRNLFLLSALLVLGACSDVVKSKYATYEQAKSDGLFERGWIPDLLPESTTQIEVNNDLDLNVSKGKFVVADSEIEGFLGQLQSTDVAGQYRFIDDTNEWTFTLGDNGLVTYELSQINR